MRVLKLLLFTISLTLLFSCNKEENEINPNLITGAWILEQVSFNEIDGTEINDWVSNSTILYIGDNNSYYRNYIGGEWSLNENKLILNPGANLKNFYWEYQILELTEKSLRVRIDLTEGQYCCNLEQFEEDELLMITENYVKYE